ncbi:MAG: deoxynucleoside kinase [Clostridiales bacterium]|nr:deoxynucleoside kinase [Clostridiales bacterium]
MKYISISGAVAAGKTTLLEKLMDCLGERAIAHEERPQNNPFIQEYYADSKRWSFHSQITFLALYFDDDRWLNSDREFYFFDRCLIENLVLARYRLNEGDLTQNEYDVIKKMAEGINRLMPPVDKYVYLRCSVPLLVQRLRERGREYEGSLGEEYARKLNELYEQWLETLPCERVLVVDEDRGVDIEAVLRFIEA